MGSVDFVIIAFFGLWTVFIFYLQWRFKSKLTKRAYNWSDSVSHSNKERISFGDDYNPQNSVSNSSYTSVSFVDHSISSPSFDNSFSSGTNPASGLPMAGSSSIDVGGNVYGTRQF